MADRARLALVPPRYGEDVVGGAELVLRQAAHGLAARGWEVEILTTCSRDHYTWANEYPPGVATDGNVTVRRFPVVRDADRKERDRLDRRLAVGLSLDPDEQLAWVNGNMRVPDLVHHLVAHGGSYRAVVFSPYLAWTTLAGVATVPERAVVIPCLHDEPFAYLDVFRPVLSAPAQVWFMSEPEHRLAHRLGPLAPHHVTGEGVLVPDGYDPERFRRKYGLSRPFVLFAGRREPLKGWNDLLAGLARAQRLGVDLDLVSFGVGWMPPPPAVAGRVIDLGYLPQEDVADAFAAAAAYVQPSPMESFSRTIMEAWLAGTPVIASGRSDVVRWHCERSGAGVVYEDIFELAQCLALVADAPQALRPLAAAGRDYVLTHYTWDVALDRMEKALEAVTPATSSPRLGPLPHAGRDAMTPARRVLVYGPYPPTPGPEAAATLAAVRSLLAQGAEVEVVSPWPSAAHHHAHVDGMRGNLRFAARVARSRPDEIIARLDPTLLRPRRAGRAEPAARRLLGVALRGATVHLPPLAGRLDPGYAGLVLGRVAQVVADTPADADALVGAGLDAGRVASRPAVPSAGEEPTPPPAGESWPVDGPFTREALEAEVRRRAAADRGDLPAAGEPVTASRPLDRIPSYGDPPTWSPRPLARLVKQVVWRLTKWEVEPLVDHVNLVHRAARAEAERQGPASTE